MRMWINISAEFRKHKWIEISASDKKPRYEAHNRVNCTPTAFPVIFLIFPLPKTRRDFSFTHIFSCDGRRRGKNTHALWGARKKPEITSKGKNNNSALKNWEWMEEKEKQTRIHKKKNETKEKNKKKDKILLILLHHVVAQKKNENLKS